ncbi:hypothetical protein MTBPR1_20152 [Candidatus Terasakiella magnetica]|uniref:Uncharacterized protein n=1 Tax=Candidatus Terasakiella magnetica TaxID=1867952 RepID=A0A1C3RGG4_9PROT|nr:hypothetical protein MTBPR1_20152 [Candidatus Terasakiella magnetica]
MRSVSTRTGRVRLQIIKSPSQCPACSLLSISSGRSWMEERSAIIDLVLRRARRPRFLLFLLGRRWIQERSATISIEKYFEKVDPTYSDLEEGTQLVCCPLRRPFSIINILMMEK